ncbi:MAG: hypothetical protein K2V38_28945, partial [Gemmataceae bacterium]|nr:hypothetical protein [Gemmataceae bacterium]
TAYANTTGTPATTVTVGAAPVVVGTPVPTSGPVVYPAGYSAPIYRGVVGGCANGSCGTVIPAGYSFPTVGGCANGRCPVR